jgi:hypothetical protein
VQTSTNNEIRAGFWQKGMDGAPSFAAPVRLPKEAACEERTEGGRSVRKNVGGVVPRFTIRAAGRVFRWEIDTVVNPDRNALCLV